MLRSILKAEPIETSKELSEERAPTNTQLLSLETL